MASPNEEIRESGLWNVNHVSKTFVPAFPEQLELAVSRLMSRKSEREQRLMLSSSIHSQQPPREHRHDWANLSVAADEP